MYNLFILIRNFHELNVGFLIKVVGMTWVMWTEINQPSLQNVPYVKKHHIVLHEKWDYRTKF